MHKLNKELAQIFEEIGFIYEFLGEENKYRATAYHNAARVLEDMPEEITEHIKNGSFIKTHGIGDSIAAKIMEYIESNKIQAYEELKNKIPHDFIDLLKVPGLGPETLKKLHEELNISTKEQLIKALEDQTVLSVKGFKQKKIDNIINGLNQQSMFRERAILWDAMELSDMLCRKIKEIPGVIKVETAGSIRRKKETIGDVDILVAAKEKDRKKIIETFIAREEIERVLAKGDTKASVIIKNFNKQVDLRIIDEKEWGAALQYFTGSKPHNIHLRKLGIEKGYKLNEYGLFDATSDKLITGESEQEVYKLLGLQFIPPELREDTGEIEFAKQNKLPALISVEQIKGDLHCHSRWSDGINSIEEIAYYVKGNFPYEYLVITDHSKSERIAGGLTEDQLILQLKEIKKINRKLGSHFLKAGVEVDILSDGTLDFADEVLEKLDWVVASVHSQFKRDNTERIIKACENPFVNVIGHPTGRLFGTREGYPLDMDKIIEVAAATHTALEINAHAHRMDLNDHWVRRAKEHGVKLVISTDSHNIGNYQYMKLGVAIARRGWCRAEDILNTRSWKEISGFRKKKQELILLKK
ncbi:MAG TPA: DNA polymerase/3'-5' exonuclease PolX [Cytophagaceae bacterium]